MKKHKFKFTVITTDGVMIHNTCKDIPELLASREKYAKKILKTRYGSKCKIVECKPDTDCKYPTGSDSAAVNRYI